MFVSRCQNLKSEFNDQAWAGKVNDGGFIYTAAQGGSSMAGKEANGGLRSYASMTYAGLKSMIYAGLSREDPRVKAALTYITQHYSLDENPGLGQQGLYYYYHTFAKTMSVLDTPTITDAAGAVARLAGRADRGPGEASATRRKLGEPGRPVHGRRPQPGHRLCTAGAGVYPAPDKKIVTGSAKKTCRALTARHWLIRTPKNLQRPKTRLRLPIFTLATDRAPESCVVIVVIHSLRF